jgi:hypothetical protein
MALFLVKDRENFTLSTNSAEQSPSWGADSHLAGQQTPRLLWNLKVHDCSQEPATGPYPEPDASNPQPPTIFP